jgi:hypothetical protein
MKIKDKVLNAFRRFLEKDGYLLAVTANERSITHRFAIYVENEFPNFNVDCEFNRNGLHPKKLDTFKKVVQSDDESGVTVYPDIIVHRRGPARENNFAVIEAKTSSNKQQCQDNDGCTCDLCKLRAYKNDLGYKFAFYVVFPVGGELKNISYAELDDYVAEI